MRRVTVGTVIDDRSVLPKERSAFFCVTGVAGLVHGVLHQERWTGRAVGVVTAGTRHFALDNRVPREAVDLCPLRLVTSETDFRLGQLVEDFLIGRVGLVTIGARHTMHFMLAPGPILPGKDTGFMAAKTGFVAPGGRR